MLQDKIALVIGGSQGIGRPIAEKLLQAGATVAIAALNDEALALPRRSSSCTEWTFQTFAVRPPMRFLPLDFSPEITDDDVALTRALGVTNVLCEVVEREPNYTEGNCTFKAIDTRGFSSFRGLSDCRHHAAIQD